MVSIVIPLSISKETDEKEPISICNYYWWFDFKSNKCSYDEFCGQYMYYGLRTFDTKKECMKELIEYKSGNKLNNLENNPNFEKIITKCNKDSDCYKLSSTTCCKCSSGGIEKAVNQKGIKYYDWYHSTCSGRIVCIMVHRCTEREPICKDRKCELGIKKILK